MRGSGNLKSWIAVVVMSFVTWPTGASAEDRSSASGFDSYAGVGYGSKSFSAFPDASNMSALSIAGVWQPKARSDSDDLIRGLGIRADLGLFNEGDVFDENGFEAVYVDAAFGYEMGRSKKFSVFAGIGLGYYAWDSSGALKPEAEFPLIWDVNATIHLGSRVLLTIGFRGDEQNEPKIEDWAGGGSIDLSGQRFYGSLALAY